MILILKNFGPRFFSRVNIYKKGRRHYIFLYRKKSGRPRPNTDTESNRISDEWRAIIPQKLWQYMSIFSGKNIKDVCA